MMNDGTLNILMVSVTSGNDLRAERATSAQCGCKMVEHGPDIRKCMTGSQSRLSAISIMQFVASRVCHVHLLDKAPKAQISEYQRFVSTAWS